MADGLMLVHGGLHGAWCWDAVLPLLDKPALAIDLPGRGSDHSELTSIRYGDWIASAAADLEQFAPERVCLVGHSLGGITVTGLAQALPDRIASLVFVSCILPAAGENAAHAIAGDDYHVRFSEGVFPCPPPEVAKQLLMQDLDDRIAGPLIARMTPEPLGPLLAPMRYEGLPQVPNTYLRLSRDHGLIPEQQDRMIANLGITDVRAIDAVHNVMVSEPELLAALLNELSSDAE